MLKCITVTLIFLTLISGCAVPPRDDKSSIGREISPPLPEGAQLEALGLQERKQYQEALTYWKDAREIVLNRIETLAKQLEELSREHSTRGVQYYKEKNGEAAFHEFMAALQLDPHNSVASNYLRKRYRPHRTTPYAVNEKDTFASIAEKAYGSSGYGFAVEFFSTARSEADLVAGAEIALADLDSFTSEAIRTYGRDIDVARGLFKAGKYEAVLPVAEALREKHPEDDETSYIVNKALLKISVMKQDEGKYDEAVHALVRVDPRFKNVEDQIAKLQEKQNKKLATDTLEANSRLLRKGTEKSARGLYFEALDILLLVDPGFEGREAALAHVRAKLKKQAEFHYKEGVMLFVEEDLAGAISQWEKALQCDPTHLDALHSIEKAHRLQQKVNTIN